MHACDCDADNGAAERRAEKIRSTDRDAEAQAGNDDRKDQRKSGEADVVGHRHARFVGKHSDEVRCPDSAAGGNAGQREPTGAGLSFAGAGVAEQLDTDEAREQTNKDRERDEAEVVLARKAVDDAIHWAPNPPTGCASPSGPTASVRRKPSAIAPIVNGGSIKPIGMG
jgi:hypothetical protein